MAHDELTMVSLSRTTDLELVRRIVTDSRIYGRMADDASPSPEEYRPMDHPEMIYLAVDLDGVTEGIFALIPHSRVMYEIHTCLRPPLYGTSAADAARQLIAWAWHNTTCVRLITAVPVFNRLAFRFASAAGLTEYGCNPKAYAKGGTLHDIIMMGISKDVT